MKIAVLGSPKSWYLNDLRRAAAGRHTIVGALFQTLRGDVEKEKRRVAAGKFFLDEFDAVLIRSMPRGSLEQIIFRMDALRVLEGIGTLVVNPPLAVETAVDKFLTTTRLAEAGIAVPRTAVCQTVEDALRTFDAFSSDAVIKPLFGSEGRGIVRVAQRASAEREFAQRIEQQSVVYLQQFVAHEGYDIRALVVDDKIFAMRRRNAADWRTNIRRGARAEPCHLSKEDQQLALRAAAAVGAPLAGVDLLPARDGRTLVIEVNAVPGWRALAGALDIDIAARVLDFLECRRG